MQGFVFSVRWRVMFPDCSRHTALFSVGLVPRDPEVGP